MRIEQIEAQLKFYRKLEKQMEDAYKVADSSGKIAYYMGMPKIQNKIYELIIMKMKKVDDVIYIYPKNYDRNT